MLIASNKSPTTLPRRQVLALLGITTAAALISRPAFAAEKAVLAWTPGASTPQIAVALEDNLWAAEDIAVDSIPFPTGREALEALLGGGANFASLAEFPVVTAAMRGQNLQVLASMSVFLGHRIIINGASGARDIAGLAGKKVGVTMGTNMQYLAETATKGVSLEFVNIAPGDLTPALARGDVDAAFMFDTFYPQAKQVLGDNYIEVLTPSYQQQFLIVANRSFVETNPGAIYAFLAGLLKADEKMADRAAAIAAVSASTGGTLTADAIATQWENYAFEVAINADLLPLMVAQGKFINSIGLIDTPATPELFRPFIADPFLAKLAPDRVAAL